MKQLLLVLFTITLLLSFGNTNGMGQSEEWISLYTAADSLMKKRSLKVNSISRINCRNIFAEE